MKKVPPNNGLTADEIGDLAEKGEDVSRYFTNKGKMKYPVKRVNVDFSIPMLQELDNIAGEMNISRQALIKTYVRQAMNKHYAAREFRNAE